MGTSVSPRKGVPSSQQTREPEPRGRAVAGLGWVCSVVAHLCPECGFCPFAAVISDLQDDCEPGHCAPSVPRAGLSRAVGIRSIVQCLPPGKHVGCPRGASSCWAGVSRFLSRRFPAPRKLHTGLGRAVPRALLCSTCQMWSVFSGSLLKQGHRFLKACDHVLT